MRAPLVAVRYQPLSGDQVGDEDAYRWKPLA